jgi:hypothetical protein
MAELVVGPFLGVIGAFAAQRAYDKYKSSQERSKLKQNIKSELEHCITLLSGKGNLIPNSMWNSAISSGDIALLSFDDRSKLSLLYFEINNHNYDAGRVLDVAVKVKTSGGTRDYGDCYESTKYWQILSKNLFEKEENLKTKIINFLKEWK